MFERQREGLEATMCLQVRSGRWTYSHRRLIGKTCLISLVRHSVMQLFCAAPADFKRRWSGPLRPPGRRGLMICLLTWLSFATRPPRDLPLWGLVAPRRVLRPQADMPTLPAVRLSFDPEPELTVMIAVFGDPAQGLPAVPWLLHFRSGF